MSILAQIVVSLLAVSAFSLVGLLYFVRQPKWSRIIPWFVSFAAGSMLAATLFDLLPEAFELLPTQAPIFVALGIIAFLIFEQVVHWHHHHNDDHCEDCPDKPMGYTVLAADALHNFIDGVVIASAYILNPLAGLSATIAVIAHEIPQEFGDFSVLLASGFKKSQAVVLNLVSALAALAGGVLTFYYAEVLAGTIPYVLAVGAGGFLYVSLTDLLGEVKHKEQSDRLKHILVVILGMAVLYLVIRYFHEG